MDDEVPLRPRGALPRCQPRARRRKMHKRAQVQMAAQIRPRVPSFRRTASASVRSRSKAAATKSMRPTRQASVLTWRSMPRRSKSSTTQKPARTDVLSAALRAGMATIRVWDPFVRAFHWSLALSFAVAWLSGEGPERLHELAGYTAGALVVARVAWGFLGTGYARFAEFVRSPVTVVDYLKSAAAGSERRFIGHNPAGGAMIIALLASITATAATGWMLTTDAFLGLDFASEGALGSGPRRPLAGARAHLRGRAGELAASGKPSPRHGDRRQARARAGRHRVGSRRLAYST